MHDWRALVRAKMPSLRVGPARENEIVAELALQMEQAYTDALARGCSEAEAFREAQGPFRDWSALGAEINDAERPAPLRGGLLAGAGKDVRYATRFLGRNPAFAAIAIFTLAFGIGGNTAIFTMVDAVALRSLPYREPDRMMAIETRKTQQSEIEPWTSILDFNDLRGRSQSFSAMSAISPVWNLIMTGRGDAQKLDVLYVSANFLPLLGVEPALGRWFRPEEDKTGAPANVVVVSHAFWRRRLGGGSDILGQTVALDNGTYSVIGVMPAGFRYAGDPLVGTAQEIDAWLPLASNQLAGSFRALRFLKAVGRLRPGVSPAQARAEIRGIGTALAEQYPDTDRGFAVDIRPLREQVTGPFRLTMWLLLGAVGFVLLMACANVANLLLARAATRERELSVRAALGASRWRLLRQMLTEGMVLAAAGGMLGLSLAWAGVKLLSAMAPPSLLMGRSIALDWRALAFTLAAVAAAALLAGLPPAWRMVRADLETALRESGKSIFGGRHWLRGALVTSQVAVALMLLVGSGLLLRSFQRLLEVNPGFDPHNLVTISTQIPASAATPQQRADVYRLMRDRLLAIPGVRNVAAVSRLPMAGRNLGSWLFAEGQPVTGAAGYDVEYRVATPTYFATMEIPLRAGRYFDDRDNANAASVILINETIARKFWPGESAVGKRIKLGANPQQLPWITVIGVVADLRHGGLDVDPRAEIYRPYAVNPLGSPILVIRTDADARTLIDTLSATVRSAGAGVPAYNVDLMQTLVDRSTAQRRFVMWLLTGFAMAALLLAAVGIYGTVSQAVAQRTPEIGLRMALGASPAAASQLVFRQGARPVAIGMAIGVAGAAGLTNAMGKLLFEVRPLDPAAFAFAAATLGLFGAAACYIPARRATRVDPLEALRRDG